EDPEEPRLQVRTRVELLPRAHRLEEGVLHQIFGLRRVSRELARDGVEGVEVTERRLGEGVGLTSDFGAGRGHHGGGRDAFLRGATPTIRRVFLRSRRRAHAKRKSRMGALSPNVPRARPRPGGQSFESDLSFASSSSTRALSRLISCWSCCHGRRFGTTAFTRSSTWCCQS